MRGKYSDLKPAWQDDGGMGNKNNKNNNNNNNNSNSNSMRYAKVGPEGIGMVTEAKEEGEGGFVG